MAARAALQIFETTTGVAPAELFAQLHTSKAVLSEAVLGCATEYEAQLQSVAKRIGVSLPSPTLSAGPIIATGHQPVVYHPGLLEKERIASQESAKIAATPINFVLDLDEQDCCSFTECTVEGALPVALPASFGAGKGLCVSQRIEIVSARSQRAESAPVIELYRKLLGEPVTVAHTIVRRMFGREAGDLPVLWEVPFSALMKNPEVAQTLQALAGANQLCDRYNSTLVTYRAAHGIKNAANPFPNIGVGELPFWIYNSGNNQRRVLKQGKPLADREMLVPRGAMVSFFLRAYCCDLFIHGLGGKSYEPFIEKLSTQLPSPVLAPYVIVSANRYPFDNLISEYERLTEKMVLLRSGPSHINALLAELSWSPEQKAQLQELAAHKLELLTKLKAEKTAGGSNTREIGQAIKNCDTAVREIIESNPESIALSRRYAELKEREDLLYARNFPFWV